MFGLIISSRPVQTSPTQLTPTQFAFTLPSIPAFSHIVVFLLPGTTLPADTAAAVYVQLPGTTNFRFLGAIANEKQSAIFRLNSRALGGGGGEVGSEALDEDNMLDVGQHVPAGGVTGNDSTPTVTIGISVEPVAQVAASLQNLKASAGPSAATASSQAQSQQPAGNELVRRPSPRTATGTKVLAQRIIKNAYDFLASFGNDTIPLKAFQMWWDKFEKKIENDPGFLERSDGG